MLTNGGSNGRSLFCIVEMGCGGDWGERGFVRERGLCVSMDWE